MKSKYKYLILIAITILASIGIYEYIEAATPVDTEEDIIAYQANRESEILSNTNYSIDNPNVILDPYNISPLTAIVVFQTSDLSTATITVKGKDGDKDITNTFLPSKTHILPIYGLYPDYENTVIISSSGEEKTLTIQTNPLPEDLKNGKSLDSDNENEFFFTTSENGKPVGYDKNGNIRWYLNKNYKWDFMRLSNGHILMGNDHLMSAPYYSTGLVEMDMLGKVYFEYNIPGGYHHDVYELSNGNFLVASNNFGSGTIEDYIVEIDRNTGEIVKNIDLYDLMPNDDGADWFKMNSLVYDASTNSITIAGSNKDMLLNIDYASGEINWIIAEKASKKYEKYLLKANGEVTLPSNPQGLVLTGNNKFAFINGGDENHLIEYEVNLNNKTFKETKNINLNDSADNVNLDYRDNTFIVNQDNVLKKITNDEVTSIIETDHNIYSTSYMNMYAGDVYIVGSGQRLGSMGVTETTKNTSILFWKTDNSVFDKYNLNIYKDINRLVINGTFKKSDDVKIILDNVLDKKTYDVIISETPYINDNKKDNEKVNVSYYINEDEMAGKYYIYLKVNGTTYKLQKYVNFY